MCNPVAMNKKPIDIKMDSRPRLSLKLKKVTRVPLVIGTPLQLSKDHLRDSSHQPDSCASTDCHTTPEPDSHTTARPDSHTTPEPIISCTSPQPDSQTIPACPTPQPDSHTTQEPDSCTPQPNSQTTPEPDSHTPLESHSHTASQTISLYPVTEPDSQPDSQTTLEPDSHNFHTPEPNSHTSQPDSHTPQPDSHTLQPDSHTLQPDSHTLQPDSHTPQPGSHASQPDSHTPQPDSRTLQRDSHTPQPGSHTTSELDSCTAPNGCTLEPDSRTTPQPDFHSSPQLYSHVTSQLNNDSHATQFDSHTTPQSDFRSSHQVDSPSPHIDSHTIPQSDSHSLSAEFHTTPYTESVIDLASDSQGTSSCATLKGKRKKKDKPNISSSCEPRILRSNKRTNGLKRFSSGQNFSSTKKIQLELNTSVDQPSSAMDQHTAIDSEDNVRRLSDVTVNQYLPKKKNSLKRLVALEKTKKMYGLKLKGKKKKRDPVSNDSAVSNIEDSQESEIEQGNSKRTKKAVAGASKAVKKNETELLVKRKKSQILTPVRRKAKTSSNTSKTAEKTSRIEEMDTQCSSSGSVVNPVNRLGNDDDIDDDATTVRHRNSGTHSDSLIRSGPSGSGPSGSGPSGSGPSGNQSGTKRKLKLLKRTKNSAKSIERTESVTQEKAKGRKRKMAESQSCPNSDFKASRKDHVSSDVPLSGSKPVRTSRSVRNYYAALKEEEDLQIALAVSASLYQQQHGNCVTNNDDQATLKNNHKRKGTKRARLRKGIDLPPLLLTSSPEAKRRLMVRVQEMLCHEDQTTGTETSEVEDIPCTPAIVPSCIGGGGAQPTSSGRVEPEKVDSLEKHGGQTSGGVETNTATGPSEANTSEIGNDTRGDEVQPENDLRSDIRGNGTESAQHENQPDEPRILKGDHTFIGCPDSVRVPTVNTAYKTMWQLSAYAEDEPVQEFFVDRLSNSITPLESNKILCARCSDHQPEHSDDSPTAATIDPVVPLDQEPMSTDSDTTDSQTIRDSPSMGPCNSQLSCDLLSLLQGGLFSDLNVLTADKDRSPLSAHRGILCTRCPNMIPLLSSCNDAVYTLDMSAFSHKAVELFLEFIYTTQLRSIPHTNESVNEELSMIAGLWDIGELVDLITNQEAERTIMTDRNHSGNGDSNGSVYKGSTQSITSPSTVCSSTQTQFPRDLYLDMYTQTQLLYLDVYTQTDTSSQKRTSSSATQTLPCKFAREFQIRDASIQTPNLSTSSSTVQTDPCEFARKFKTRSTITQTPSAIIESSSTQTLPCMFAREVQSCDVLVQTITPVHSSCETQTVPCKFARDVEITDSFTQVTVDTSSSTSQTSPCKVVREVDNRSTSTQTSRAALSSSGIQTVPCRFARKVKNVDSSTQTTGFMQTSSTKGTTKLKRHKVASQEKPPSSTQPATAVVNGTRTSESIGWSSSQPDSIIRPPSKALAGNRSKTRKSNRVTKSIQRDAVTQSSQITSSLTGPTLSLMTSLAKSRVSPSTTRSSSPSPSPSCATPIITSSSSRELSISPLLATPTNSLPHSTTGLASDFTISMATLTTPTCRFSSTPAISTEMQMPNSLQYSVQSDFSLGKESMATIVTSASLPSESPQRFKPSTSHSLISSEGCPFLSPSDIPPLISTTSPLAGLNSSLSLTPPTGTLHATPPIPISSQGGSIPDPSTGITVSAAATATAPPSLLYRDPFQTPSSSIFDTPGFGLEASHRDDRMDLDLCDTLSFLNKPSDVLRNSVSCGMSSGPGGVQNHTESNRDSPIQIDQEMCDTVDNPRRSTSTSFSKAPPTSFPEAPPTNHSLFSDSRSSSDEDDDSTDSDESSPAEIIYLKEDSYSPYPPDTALEIEFPNSGFNSSESSNSAIQNIRVVQTTPAAAKYSDSDSNSSPLTVSDKHLVTPVLNRNTEGIINADVSVAMEVSVFSDDPLDLYHQREHAERERFPVYTPANRRSDLHTTSLLSDENITPMPSFRTMATPSLKEACSSYGVRPLPKGQMIAKLEEIYNYTHPLVDKDGNVVVSNGTARKKNPGAKKPSQKRSTAATKKKHKNIPNHHDNEVHVQGNIPGSEASRIKEDDPNDSKLIESVVSAIKRDPKLHQDIVLYKPLGLIFIQAKLKENGVSLSRGKLSNILDRLGVTFTTPKL